MDARAGGGLALGLVFSTALAGDDNGVPPMPEARIPQTEMGITQLPNEKLTGCWTPSSACSSTGACTRDWPGGVGDGEPGIPAEKYRELAYPASGDSILPPTITTPPTGRRWQKTPA